jgi:hypothetical protein
MCERALLTMLLALDWEDRTVTNNKAYENLNILTTDLLPSLTSPDHK